MGHNHQCDKPTLYQCCAVRFMAGYLLTQTYLFFLIEKINCTDNQTIISILFYFMLSFVLFYFHGFTSPGCIILKRFMENKVLGPPVVAYLTSVCQTMFFLLHSLCHSSIIYILRVRVDYLGTWTTNIHSPNHQIKTKNPPTKPHHCFKDCIWHVQRVWSWLRTSTWRHFSIRFTTISLIIQRWKRIESSEMYSSRSF